MTNSEHCIGYEEIFEALAAVGAKAVLRQYFREDSCIDSTSVLLEVFRALGLPASPFSVCAMVFFEGFLDRVGREGRLPRSDAEVQEWTAEPGVQSVGVGFGRIDLPKDAWPGHLVLRAGDNLRDATICQASRPGRGISLSDISVVTNVPEAFWLGDRVVLHGMSGCLVRYEPQPKNNGYVMTPAWNSRLGTEDAAYRELMKLLGTYGVAKNKVLM